MVTPVFSQTDDARIMEMLGGARQGAPNAEGNGANGFDGGGSNPIPDAWNDYMHTPLVELAKSNPLGFDQPGQANPNANQPQPGQQQGGDPNAPAGGEPQQGQQPGQQQGGDPNSDAALAERQRQLDQRERQMNVNQQGQEVFAQIQREAEAEYNQLIAQQIPEATARDIAMRNYNSRQSAAAAVIASNEKVNLASQLAAESGAPIDQLMGANSRAEMARMAQNHQSGQDSAAQSARIAQLEATVAALTGQAADVNAPRGQVFQNGNGAAQPAPNTPAALAQQIRNGNARLTPDFIRLMEANGIYQ